MENKITLTDEIDDLLQDHYEQIVPNNVESNPELLAIVYKMSAQPNNCPLFWESVDYVVSEYESDRSTITVLTEIHEQVCEGIHPRCRNELLVDDRGLEENM